MEANLSLIGNRSFDWSCSHRPISEIVSEIIKQIILTNMIQYQQKFEPHNIPKDLHYRMKMKQVNYIYIKNGNIDNLITNLYKAKYEEQMINHIKTIIIQVMYGHEIEMILSQDQQRCIILINSHNDFTELNEINEIVKYSIGKIDYDNIQEINQLITQWCSKTIVSQDIMTINKYSCKNFNLKNQDRLGGCSYYDYLDEYEKDLISSYISESRYDIVGSNEEYGGDSNKYMQRALTRILTSGKYHYDNVLVDLKRISISSISDRNNLTNLLTRAQLEREYGTITMVLGLEYEDKGIVSKLIWSDYKQIQFDYILIVGLMVDNIRSNGFKIGLNKLGSYNIDIGKYIKSLIKMDVESRFRDLLQVKRFYNIKWNFIGIMMSIVDMYEEVGSSNFKYIPNEHQVLIIFIVGAYEQILKLAIWLTRHNYTACRLIANMYAARSDLAVDFNDLLTIFNKIEQENDFRLWEIELDELCTYDKMTDIESCHKVEKTGIQLVMFTICRVLCGDMIIKKYRTVDNKHIKNLINTIMYGLKMIDKHQYDSKRREELKRVGELIDITLNAEDNITYVIDKIDTFYFKFRTCYFTEDIIIQQGNKEIETSFAVDTIIDHTINLICPFLKNTVRGIGNTFRTIGRKEHYVNDNYSLSANQKGNTWTL